MDQRGTGGSNQLLWQDTPDLSGLSPHEMSVTLAAWLDQALAALDADPRFYASPQAADDLDDVRVALGYDRIDLYGGLRSDARPRPDLRQHGPHVRSVVLDGGTLLDVPIFELIPRNSQAALDRVLNAARPTGVATRRSPTPPATSRARWARLARHPVRTAVRDPWTDEPIVVDAGALAGEIHSLLVISDSADVPMVLHQAAHRSDRTDR